MAEITRRRMAELVRGVFSVLLEAPDGLPASRVLQMVEQRVPPTVFEREMLPKHPKVRRYANVIRWSTATAVKAGWMVKAKGEWSLTDEGRAAYAAYNDSEVFKGEADRLYKPWKKTARRSTMSRKFRTTPPPRRSRRPRRGLDPRAESASHEGGCRGSFAQSLANRRVRGEGAFSLLP